MYKIHITVFTVILVYQTATTSSLINLRDLRPILAVQMPVPFIFLKKGSVLLTHLFYLDVR